MSIDDDYFDLEAAIEAGEFSEENARLIERILEALSDEERRVMALEDKLRFSTQEADGLRYAVADAKLAESRAIKARDRLRKQLKG